MPAPPKLPTLVALSCLHAAIALNEVAPDAARGSHRGLVEQLDGGRHLTCGILQSRRSQSKGQHGDDAALNTWKGVAIDVSYHPLPGHEVSVKEHQDQRAVVGAA